MGFNKNNDWMAVSMNIEENNLNIGTLDLYANGITPDNTGIRDRDYYKNIPQVQEKFKSKTGFDEVAFNQYYDSVLRQYNEFAEINFAEKMLDEIGTTPYDSSIINNPEKRVRQINAVLTPFHDKNRSTYGTANLWETGSPTFSDREVAQANYVRDENGNILDWTPNDRAGILSSLFTPTLVYASYDEDVYDEQGRLIHQKGELKLDENGDPYTQLLGDNDSYGKDIVRWTDHLTVEGTFLNKIDVFDSDSLDKSVGKVIAKTALMIAPYFTPIGGAWGWINAATGLATAAPTLIKSLDSIITGSDDNSLGKSMTWLENQMGRFKPTTSDASRGKFWTWENLGDLIVSSSGQLYSQRQIANSLYKWAPFSDPKKNKRLAETLSTGYMAVTSSEESYGRFKEAGASDTMAGIGMLLTTAGFYTLLQNGYFKDKLFEGTLLDEDQRVLSNISQLSEYAMKKVFPNLQEVSKEEAKKGIASAWKWMSDKLSKFPKGFAYEARPLLSRSINEGVEEFSEEIAQDAVTALAKGLEWVGFDVTEGVDKLDFNWDLQSALSRYGTSFIGGALGGMVFEAYNLRDLYKNPEYRKLLNATPIRRMYHDIAQGKADKYRKLIRKRGAEGKNGNLNLTASYKTVEGTEGSGVKTYSTGTETDNQNLAITNALLDLVNNAENAYSKYNLIFTNKELVEQVLQTKSMQEYLESEEISEDEFKARGLLSRLVPTEGVSQDAYAVIDALFELEASDSDGKFKFFDIIAENVLNDVSNLRDEIVDLELDINSELAKYPELERKTEEDRKNLIKNNAHLKKMVELRDAKVKEFQEIISGKYSDHFLAQTLMFFDDGLFTTYAGMGDKSLKNVRNYAKLQHGIADWDTLDDKTKAFIERDYNNFVSKKIALYRNVANLHINLSEAFKEPLKKIEDTLKDATESTMYLLRNQRMTIGDAIKQLDEERIRLEAKIAEYTRAGADESDEGFKNTILQHISVKRNLNYFESLDKEMRFGEWFRYDLDGLSSTEDNLRKQEHIKSIYEKSISDKAVYVGDDFLKSYLNSIDFGNVITQLGQHRETLLAEQISIKSVISKYEELVGQLDNRDEIIFKLESKIKESGYNGVLDLLESLDIDQYTFSEAISQSESLFNEDTFNNLRSRFENLIVTAKTNPKLFPSEFESLIAFLSQKNSYGEPLIQWDRFKFAKGSIAYLKDVKNPMDFIKKLFDPEGKNDIVQFILDTVEIINNLPKSPLNELLNDLSMELFGEKSRVLQFLTDRLADLNAAKYDQYIMSGNHAKEIAEIDGLLNVLQGLLEGSMYGGMNELVNTRRTDKLTLLSENTVKILAKELQLLKNKLKALKDLSDVNSGNKIAENKNAFKIDSVKRFMGFMNPEGWIQELSQKLASVPEKYGDFKSFKDFASKSDFDIEKINSWSEEDFSNFYVVEAEFKENLYKWFSELDKSKQSEVIEMIVNSDLNANELLNRTSDEFATSAESRIGAWGSFRYLLANMTTSFYEFTDIQDSITPEDPEFLPFYNQEFVIRDVYSSYVASDIYDEFITKLGERFRSTAEEGKNGDYKRTMKTIRNFFFVDGAPGTGKSTAVTYTVIQILKKKFPDLQIIATVQAKDRIKDFATILGIPEDNCFVSDEFVETYVYEGIITTDKTSEESNWHTSTKVIPDKIKGIKEFGTPSKHYLFVADEATFINEAQIEAIDKWLDKYNGVGKKAKLLGLGDFYQSGNSDGEHTDISDCFFNTSVRLTSTFRYANNGKANNEVVIRGITKSAISKWDEDKDTDTSDLSEAIVNGLTDTQKPLIGWIDNGKVFGDVKIEGSETISKIQQLVSSYKDDEKKSVCIITNDPNNYTEFASIPGVSVKSPKQAQGGEWDFVVCDIPFEFNKKNGWNNMRMFYTIMTRSKIGTIWSGPIFQLRFENKPEAQRSVGQDLSNEKIRKEYVAWRKKLFALVPKPSGTVPDSGGSTDNGEVVVPPLDDDVPDDPIVQRIDEKYSDVTAEEIEKYVNDLYLNDTEDEQFRKTHNEHIKNFRTRKELIDSNQTMDYDYWYEWIHNDDNLKEQIPYDDPSTTLSGYRNFLKFTSESLLEALSTNKKEDVESIADILIDKFRNTPFRELANRIAVSMKDISGSFYARKVGEINGVSRNIVYYVFKSKDGVEKVVPVFSNRSSVMKGRYKWNSIKTEFRVKPIPISSNGEKFVPFSKMSDKVSISSNIVIFNGVKDISKLSDREKKFQRDNQGKAFILVSRITDVDLDDWTTSEYLKLKYNDEGEITYFVTEDGNLYASLVGIQRVCTKQEFVSITEAMAKCAVLSKSDLTSYEDATKVLTELLGYRVDFHKETRETKGTYSPNAVFSPEATNYLLNLFIRKAASGIDSKATNTIARLNKPGSILRLKFGYKLFLDIVNYDGVYYLGINLGDSVDINKMIKLDGYDEYELDDTTIYDYVTSLFVNAIKEGSAGDSELQNSLKQALSNLGIDVNLEPESLKHVLKDILNKFKENSDNYENSFDFKYINELNGVEYIFSSDFIHKFIDILTSDKLKQELLDLSTYFRHSINFKIHATKYLEESDGAWGIADPSTLDGFGSDVVEVFPSTYVFSFTGKGDENNPINFKPIIKEGEIFDSSKSKYDLNGIVYKFEPPIVVNREWLFNHCDNIPDGSDYQITEFNQESGELTIRFKVGNSTKLWKTKIDSNTMTGLISAIPQSAHRDLDGKLIVKSDSVTYNGQSCKLLGFNIDGKLVFHDGQGVLVEQISNDTSDQLSNRTIANQWNIDIVTTYEEGKILNAIGVNQDGFYIISDILGDPSISETLDVSDTSVNGIPIEIMRISQMYGFETKRNLFKDSVLRNIKQIESTNELVLKSVISTIEAIVNDERMSISDAVNQINNLLDENKYPLGGHIKINSDGSFVSNYGPEFKYGQKVLEYMGDSWFIKNLGLGDRNSVKFSVTLQNHNTNEELTKEFSYDSNSEKVYEIDFKQEDFINAVEEISKIAPEFKDELNQFDINKIFSEKNMKDLKIVVNTLAAMYYDNDAIRDILDNINNKLKYC